MSVVTKLSLMQLVFTIIFSVLVAVLWGFPHAGSAFLGGIICVTANLFFAGKLYLSKNIEKPEYILHRFYRSEVMKLLFTFAMFTLVFVLLDVHFIAFILAYSFAALLNLLCLPFLKD